MTDTLTRVRLATEAMTKDVAAGGIPTASMMELLFALLMDGPSPEAITVSASIIKDGLGETAKDFGTQLLTAFAPAVAIASALTAEA